MTAAPENGAALVTSTLPRGMMTRDHLSKNLVGIASRIERQLTGWSRTLVALSFLTGAAYFYYGSFYNYGFNLADEGSAALISEKLAKGETPYVDIELGYGILWFLPVAFLFKAFGVKLYILQIYFLVIAFASAAFAYGLLLRLTACRALAFSVALVVLAFPGWSFQPQIPFLVISGLYVLFLYDPRTGAPRIPSSLASLCNGAYLSLAFLIRGDIATVFTLLFLFYQGLLASIAAMSEPPVASIGSSTKATAFSWHGGSLRW